MTESEARLAQRVAALERENAELRAYADRQGAALARASELVRALALGACSALVRAEEGRAAFEPLVGRALHEAEAPDPYLSTAGQRRAREHRREGPDFVFGAPSQREGISSVPEGDGNAEGDG